MLNPDLNPTRDDETELVTVEEPQATRATSPLWVAGKTMISAVLAIAIVAGAVTVMQRLIDSRPEVPQRPAVERQVPVLTQTAQVATHSPTIRVFGEVVAGRLVDLRALVAGEITGVHPNLEAGRRIDAGAPLVEIDRFSYEGAVVEAEANLAEARASRAESEARSGLERDQLARSVEQVNLAERDLARASQLVERGQLTERDLEARQLTLSQRQQAVDQREANLRVEEARLDQLRAQIARLEWRLQQAERDLERTTLLAPFAGVIRSESVEIGRLISVNDAVATIYDDSALNVRFTLSDSQFGRLTGEVEPLIGRPITVTWSTGGQDVQLAGTIDRLDSDISAASGGVALFGRLDTEQMTANLRPGAFVSVSLADQAFSNTIRIPETALYNTDHLFTVVDDRLQRRDVELVAWDGSHALVRAVDDISLDGAEIVTSRLTDAGDGVAVRRVQPAS
ncbi:efflux RND transporter periplasmic adaptor subunit [Ahrensia marina]|uniref:efflux RND transporter periplasmic adaptor subunit n=1 Tax=Ahrensia marina TaxID=1514904 RepID=UPI0035CF36C6